MNFLSQSEENYIKAIYALSETTSDPISTNLLAEKIGSKASSVTDMLKKLTAKELVTYTKYQGCGLSPLGLVHAIAIVRKHRLWEVFLVDKLHFGWHEVHVIAEQLEHIQSTQLINKLDEFLDFPKVDPHGDLIPNQNGEFDTTSKRILLSACEINAIGQVMGVEDGEPEFLQYLNAIGLRLGSRIEIKNRFSFDHSISLLLEGKEVQFSQMVASRISIQLSE